MRAGIVIACFLLVAGCTGPRWLRHTEVSDQATMELVAAAARQCGYEATRLEKIHTASRSSDTRLYVLVPKGRKDDGQALSDCVSAWFKAHPELEFEIEVQVRD